MLTSRGTIVQSFGALSRTSKAASMARVGAAMLTGTTTIEGFNPSINLPPPPNPTRKVNVFAGTDQDVPHREGTANENKHLARKPCSAWFCGRKARVVSLCSRHIPRNAAGAICGDLPLPYLPSMQAQDLMAAGGRPQTFKPPANGMVAPFLPTSPSLTAVQR